MSVGAGCDCVLEGNEAFPTHMQLHRLAVRRLTTETSEFQIPLLDLDEHTAVTATFYYNADGSKSVEIQNSAVLDIDGRNRFTLKISAAIYFFDRSLVLIR